MSLRFTCFELLLRAPDGRHPSASINFITAHSWFTLADLVSYNEKHNEAEWRGQPRRYRRQPLVNLRCGPGGRSDNLVQLP